MTINLQMTPAGLPNDLVATHKIVSLAKKEHTSQGKVPSPPQAGVWQLNSQSQISLLRSSRKMHSYTGEIQSKGVTSEASEPLANLQC